MSIEAGKSVIITRDCKDERVRGALGTVYAYATDGTVWITLDKPIGELRSIRISVEHMRGHVRPIKRRSIDRQNDKRLLP